MDLTGLVLFGNNLTDYLGGDSSKNLECHSFAGSKPYGVGETCSDGDDSCNLILGLGPTPSFYGNSGTQKVKNSANGLDPTTLQLALPSDVEEPSAGMENFSPKTPSFLDNWKRQNGSPVSLVSDEGSTSAKVRSCGCVPTLLGDACSGNGDDPTVQKGRAGRAHHQTQQPKKCRFDGCSKGARGASGLCIGHGGGQRCSKPGCHRGAESTTPFCKGHGGGKRCQQLGCTKSAEGKTDFCIAHGGGRRCGHPAGCSRAARGKSGLCIRHGGGKRCSFQGCTRSAEGQQGLCISHGGGRRCQHPQCTKGAQGSTMYCKAHGGGKRCVFQGCTKGAEGSTQLCKGHGGGKRCLFEGGGVCPKSVHGGTDYCVAHGGGKRCNVPGCTRSARGRTDCCVRHGGGKRCKFQACTKSAQGSTDFCKAHGGGKRCAWAQGCDKFARGRSGMCAAHGNMVTSSGPFPAWSPACVVGGDSSITTTPVATNSSSLRDVNNVNMMAIPAMVVPRLLKSNGFSTSSRTNTSANVVESRAFAVPEGRVHNGGLMSLLGGDIHNAIVD